MKILLTGSEGYIGTNLKRLLDYRDHDIVCVDKKIGKNVLDLTYDDLNGVDVIIHLAANSGVGEIEANGALAVENVKSTNHLLNLCSLCARQVKWPRFIFASTCQVLNLQNLYGISKCAEERIIQDRAGKNVILRFYNVIGGVLPDKTRDHLLPKLMTAIKDNKIFEIYGSEEQLRAYVHVRRICNAIEEAVNAESIQGIKYYVASELMRVTDVIQRVEKILNVKINTKIIDSRIGDITEVILPADQSIISVQYKDIDRAILDYAREFGIAKNKTNTSGKASETEKKNIK